jgi:ribonuclease Z
MIEIAFLGTSASAPSVERGLSSAMVMFRAERFLVDCGEGTQRQILCSGLGFKRLNKVLLTHGHLDHILGLGGLVSTFARWESASELSIYGGSWALDRVRDLMKVVLRGDEPAIRLHYTEIEPGLIWEDEWLTVSAFPVSHRGPGCFGFAFEERSRRPFLADIADALGVPAGPERKKLVAGESVTLQSGLVVEPDHVLGEPVPGTKLVFVGDAGRVKDLTPFAEDADALVIESTYVERDADLAARFGHITASQSATLARDAGAKQLFLVHLSRRYSDREILREAASVFPDVIVPRDLEVYSISRKD